MHWLDMIKFNPLVERLTEIDHELAGVHQAISRRDLDPLCLLDDAEELAGEGFLLCQLYMVERKGEVESSIAYACGPRHNTRYFAQVMNAAGNYRKHRAEWPDDPLKWKDGPKRTAAIIRDAGVVEDEFWLANLLFHLNKPDAPLFVSLIPRLIEWREAFDRLPKPSSLPAG